MKDNTILVVEDEPNVAEVVSLYLRRAGFNVVTANDGSAAMEILEKDIPLLVVLDLMLPGVDGWEITRWLRARSEVPIIILTARKEEVERIAGLEMGADDYVMKPFSPQELVSRVRAVLRRTKIAGETEKTPLRFGELIINPQARLVTFKGVEIVLTAKEFDVLWLLARHPRQVFTRIQILESVWGLAEFIDPSTVTVHIRRLREKMESDPASPHFVQTVWGVGYKFEA